MAISTEKADETMKLNKPQIEVTMFACGAKEIREGEIGNGRPVARKQVNRLYN